MDFNSDSPYTTLPVTIRPQSTFDFCRSLIRDVPDFPKPGIVFKDITPVLADPTLFPLAIESFQLDGYDLVISSSHAVAKGALAPPGALHVSYVHSPMRYAWDLQHQYLREAGLTRGARGLICSRG